MKNYNTELKNANTPAELKAVINSINTDILDGNAPAFDLAELTKAQTRATDSNKNTFANSFLLAMQTDRQTAFSSLFATPYYMGVSVKQKGSTYTFNETKRLFRFADLEKAFRLLHSTETDNKGNAKQNTSVTIFDKLRFYGLVSAFLRNLQKDKFDIDGEGYTLENLVLDGEKKLTKKEGEAFASHSNNALVTQFDAISKFFCCPVHLYKKDLPTLRDKATKIKQDRETAKFSHNAIIDDNAVLAFADVIFGVIASRRCNEDIAVITSKPSKAE